MSWIEDPGVAYVRGFNITSLGLDEAWVNVTSYLSDALYMFELSSDCHRCPYRNKTTLSQGVTYHFRTSTKFPSKYRFRFQKSEDETGLLKADNTDELFCEMTPDFGEFGAYNIELSETNQGVSNRMRPSCTFETISEPVNIYYPLLLALLFYLVFGVLLLLVLKLVAVFKNKKSSSSGSSTTSAPTSSSSHSPANKTPSSSSNDAPGGSGGGIEVPHQPIYVPLGKRMSSASSAGNVMMAPNGHPQSRANSIYGSSNNIYGYSNGVQYIPQGPPTTQVAISTISSTPTSAVTTGYHMVPNHHHPIHHGSTMSVNNNGGVPLTLGVVEDSKSREPSAVPVNGSNNATAAQKQQRQRLRSLDTFRGMCIILMIFVNDGGAGYYFFEHATWDGLYVADLVFPWFLWIMGVCIPVSIKSQLKRGSSKLSIFQKILVRSVKLVLLGLVLGSLWGPVDIHSMRIPGVLQRFGICYLVCCTLVLVCMTSENITKPEAANKIRAALQDVEIIWMSWIVVLLIVLLHCCLTFFLKVEGCPTGYLGPGGLHDFKAIPYTIIPSHCIGGASGYIDQKVLLPRHLYQWPTARYTYHTEASAFAYDPEGLLGKLTSIFQVWVGVQIGITMLVYPSASSRLKRWGAWALLNGALGALLCGCKQFDGWIPLNKNLWSLSYVLVTNFMAIILLMTLYFVIDIKRWWSGTPFMEPGMNSILLYVAHSVCNRMLPWHYVYGPMRTHFSRLIESLWGTSLWVILSIYLYAKKIFWTV